ncbi:PREDICTED: uncharacterized protein LOC109584161 [Amphimedon queenslandica]|uniref:GAIN-B domain-containing protein n=1 Tax=Amphimedon queenslandica TaxID=400682 RepID=A0AAN0JF72_AMPQE|nr:PREDICTED: uncharacterized protein LOC109584161 [Amphimedon queenslandica]|eukprot:XP_019855328.1 PREDICTED: uncharacterized protein LOC109584161 [Amphimedon queenslandica]
MSQLVSTFFFFLFLLLSVLVIPVTESKEPVATLSFSLSRPANCIGVTSVFINIWIESSSGYSLCSRINVGTLTQSRSNHSFSICQPDDVIFHFSRENLQLGSNCGLIIISDVVVSVKVSNSTYAVPVKRCSESPLSLSSPIIRINKSVSVLNSMCSCNKFMIMDQRPSLVIPNDLHRCFDDQRSCPEDYSIPTPPLLQCLPGKSLITGTCNKGLFNETSSCSQCGQLNEPVCNYDTQFSGIISMINQSANGALQNLSKQLNQFTPEQSIVLFDTIISRGINTSVVNATEMVLRTAELIVNKLPINEAVTVKHSVATQFLLSLDTFALKVAQSTSFGYGNTFLNVTRNESFSGERLTVLNYNGNSLSLPAKILNNSLPATVASFVYSNLSSILSPSDGRKLISPVISAAVNCIGTCITSELTEPVVISFTLLRHTQPILSSAISCVFWNISRSNDLLPSGFWDTEGCNASSVDQQSVTCQCNHFAHFAILPVNQSTIGALQNLFEELDQFTPEQSITLLDNIINEVINITVDVTEMVLKTAELIVNKLTVNETRTVTQFLLSLDTFALKVAQSTSFGYGNTFSNVTQIESFSGERLTVLNYNGNSLSLPAMIFNNSLPATVASFVYSGNKLLSILSPTEPDNRKLISPVVSATVECNSTCITSELTEPVVITFALLRHAQLISFSTISCVFWNTTLGFWDNEGCNASSVDQQSVTCHCNHLTHFAILPVNRSPIGALQSLFEELDRLTPEQSITLLDNIINRVINITVDVTEMVLRTAELIINELPTNELVTVKLSVVTQFLVSLDTFALNVAESTILPQSTNLTQSTPLNFGNIFLNVTRIESFSGERLTVLNYNGNSLSLPAMIFIDSLPATVASFVYSGNSLLSILSPTEPDNRELISPVISATVECNGTCITDELTEPVIISFNLSGYTEQTLSSMSSPNISCVFWNIALSNDSLPSGFWDNEGCNVASVDQQSVTCHCNHFAHFAILPVNQSPIDALQNLFEELDQFTPEQSITLLGNIINEVINITVDVTQMVLKTAELIVNKLPVNETGTVTQLLVSLEAFALKVAQSTPFDYGNTFSNVTQIESFSGERLTVLDYNGNSLSLPAKIFNNSLPATVASFVYRGNNLLSILSPTEPDSRKLISPVISATVECNGTCITSELTEPVVISFALLRHTLPILSSTISCVFWNITRSNDLLPSGFWDTEGCNVASVNQQSVTCHCDHLTHFAILPVNQSPIGALQSLFEELDQFTPVQSIELLDIIINRVINITVDVTEMVLRTAELIINELPTNELVTVKLSVVTQFLVSLDTFALNLAQSTNLTQSTNLAQSTSLDFGNIFFNVTWIESFSGERLTVLNYNGNSLSLPAMIFIDSLPATVASFVYSGSNLLLILSPTEPDNRELISPVISATVECNGTCITDELTEPVIISFNLSGYTEQTLSPMSSPNISCVFWNIALSNDSLPSGFWDDEGCNASLVDEQSVTCQCNHLTHFAILLSPASPPAESFHPKIWTLAGQILAPFSLVCLLMVILTYSCLRSLRNMRNYIHIMLCSNLFISKLIFLIGIQQTANPVSFIIVTM